MCRWYMIGFAGLPHYVKEKEQALEGGIFWWTWCLPFIQEFAWIRKTVS